ncbi:hypothetical protein Tco_1566199 [Tanacetum coccineum]
MTRFGRVPVSVAKQSSLRATTSASTFRPVNTATHTNRVNVSKLRTNAFHKSHSPIRRPFHKSTAPNTSILNEKVNTVRVKGVNIARKTAVSTFKGNGVTTVKASTGCVWRPKMTDLNNVSKDNSGSWVSKRGNPQQALKNKGIFDSGCSRHMTGNKDFLTDYQELDEDLDTYNSPFADQVMGAEADFNNMEPSTIVSHIPTTRVHSIHPKDQIFGDPKSAVQTRGMSKKNFKEHATISYIQKQKRTNHKDFHNCLIACFLSQQEPTKIAQALDDESWVEAMQEELLQFKIQKV